MEISTIIWLVSALSAVNLSKIAFARLETVPTSDSILFNSILELFNSENVALDILLIKLSSDVIWDKDLSKLLVI